MLSPDNRDIHSLWIGTSLSSIELLTIYSFIANGHRFHLWTYGDIKSPLPDKVVVEDASQILDKGKIFRYKNKNKFGHGQGSVSGFSDIFRYKLLYEKGGWWSDMDVCCLKPLQFNTDYVFREHHEFKVVGNVMKCMAGSELMRLCYEQARMEITADNTDWHKPIKILNQIIDKLKLAKFIVPGISNRDWWNETRNFFCTYQPIPPQWYFIHLMNEELRSRGIDKNDIYYRSTIWQLMKKYDVIDEQHGAMKAFKNFLRHKFAIRY